MTKLTDNEATFWRWLNHQDKPDKKKKIILNAIDEIKDKINKNHITLGFASRWIATFYNAYDGIYIDDEQIEKDIEELRESIQRKLQENIRELEEKKGKAIKGLEKAETEEKKQELEKKVDIIEVQIETFRNTEKMLENQKKNQAELKTLLNSYFIRFDDLESLIEMTSEKNKRSFLKVLSGLDSVHNDLKKSIDGLNEDIKHSQEIIPILEEIKGMNHDLLGLQQKVIEKIKSNQNETCFNIDIDSSKNEFIESLNNGNIHENLKKILEEKGIVLTNEAEPKEDENNTWIIKDDGRQKCRIEWDEDRGKLKVYFNIFSEMVRLIKENNEDINNAHCDMVKKFSEIRDGLEKLNENNRKRLNKLWGAIKEDNRERLMKLLKSTENDGENVQETLNLILDLADENNNKTDRLVENQTEMKDAMKTLNEKGNRAYKKMLKNISKQETMIINAINKSTKIVTDSSSKNKEVILEVINILKDEIPNKTFDKMMPNITQMITELPDELLKLAKEHPEIVCPDDVDLNQKLREFKFKRWIRLEGGGKGIFSKRRDLAFDDFKKGINQLSTEEKLIFLIWPKEREDIDGYYAVLTKPKEYIIRFIYYNENEQLFLDIHGNKESNIQDGQHILYNCSLKTKFFRNNPKNIDWEGSKL